MTTIEFAFIIVSNNVSGKVVVRIEIVGQMTEQILNILNIETRADNNIYLGDSNINHMISKHPSDYEKYGDKIKEILSAPDYVGKNPKDGSIEYVKEFKVNNEYVKVAVRLSNQDKFFARSLYVLNDNRVKNFIASGTLKCLKFNL